MEAVEREGQRDLANIAVKRPVLDRLNVYKARRRVETGKHYNTSEAMAELMDLAELVDVGIFIQAARNARQQVAHG